MSQDKFIELQTQVKHNNDELLNYINDLNSWEDEIKQKENSLKCESFEDKKFQIRNVGLKSNNKKMKKTRKNKIKNAKDDKKIKCCDYQAWDKFDVDKVCEEIDNSSIDSTEESNEEEELQRKILLANNFKEEGNEHFKNGDYSLAIEKYTKGIELNPENSVLFANRAMALLKQDKYASAEIDCTASLKLDNKYVKAYMRRSNARQFLKQYEESRKDIEEVLKIEPSNKQAQNQLIELNMLINPIKSVSNGSCETGIVKPIFKPLNQHSKKPLKRIKIEEIDLDDIQILKPIFSLKKEKNQNNSDLFLKKSEISNCYKSEKTNEYPHIQKESNLKFTNDEIRAYCNIDIPLHFNNESKIDNLDIEKNEKIKKNLIISPSINEDMKSEDTNSSISTNRASKIELNYPVPQNSFQFQTIWKKIKLNEEEFFNYFVKINPETLPCVFGEAFESDIFVKIIHILKNVYVKNLLDIFPVLFNLTKVKRFSMNVIFLSSKEKEFLQELFNYVTCKFEKYTNENIAQLKELYDF